MTDFPTLFSAPMVHALVREADVPGTGKTQTRRILSPHNTLRDGHRWSKQWAPYDGLQWDRAWIDDGPSPAGNPGPYLKAPWPAEDTIHRVYPLVQPGDRLWVREAWRTLTSFNGMTGTEIAKACTDAGYKRPWAPLVYEADGQRTGSGMEWGGEEAGRYRHGRFMPRWASRLTLTITDVRVQRLQDISETDAMAEGATSRPGCYGFYGDEDGWSMDWSKVGRPSKWANDRCNIAECDIAVGSAKSAFAGFINQLHDPKWNHRGDGIFGQNPWVLAYTFAVERRNIDNAQTGAEHE